METKKYEKFQMSLQKALVAIGLTNGHAPQPSQDPLDALLHELFVAKEGVRVFEKRVENAITRVKEALEPKHEAIMKRMVETAKDLKKKQEAVIIDAQDYSFVFTAQTPASRFKKEKILPFLRKQGWSEKQVEALIAACTEDGEPAKSYNALPIRD